MRRSPELPTSHRLGQPSGNGSGGAGQPLCFSIGPESSWGWGLCRAFLVGGICQSPYMGK